MNCKLLLVLSSVVSLVLDSLLSLGAVLSGSSSLDSASAQRS